MKDIYVWCRNGKHDEFSGCRKNWSNEDCRNCLRAVLSDNKIKVPKPEGYFPKEDDLNAKRKD